MTQNPSAYRFPDLKKGSPYDTTEKLNSYNDITTYNNFYEFGLDKADPARYAHTLKPRPWSIVVEGECNKPGRYDIEDFTKGLASKSASIACAASKPGRWSFRGSASP